MSRAQNSIFQGAFAVTPSATVDLATPSFGGLWVGGAGAINAIMRDGSTVLFSGIPAGTWMPICVTRVLVAGTTATLITALR